MLRFLRSLRGKLILTYTIVTVLALLALEVLALGVMGAAGLYVLTGDPNRDGYLTDVISTLAPQARAYLQPGAEDLDGLQADRKSTRLNSSHANISYAVFCLKKKKKTHIHNLVHYSRSYF